MSPQFPQSGVAPLSRSIDHYFELSLYLLVLTGFGTLASTGGLDIPSVILVGVALAVRGYLLAKRQPFVISDAWTTPLSVGYFSLLRRRLFHLFPQLSPRHGSSRIVRRRRADVLAAPRARPRHPRNPRFPDGPRFRRADRRQHFSILVRCLHDDRGRYLRPDGNAPLGACGQHSGSAFERPAGASPSGVRSRQGCAWINANDSCRRRCCLLSDAPHVGGIHGRIFLRHRPLLGFQ